MVRQEATVIRCQTADYVPTTGSAVSGVLDGVGLVSSAKDFHTACATEVKLERQKSGTKLTSMIASPFASSSIVGAGSFDALEDSGLAEG